MISINSQYWLDFFNDYLTPTLLGSVSSEKNSMTYMANVSDKSVILIGAGIYPILLLPTMTFH